MSDQDEVYPRVSRSRLKKAAFTLTPGDDPVLNAWAITAMGYRCWSLGEGPQNERHVVVSWSHSQQLSSRIHAATTAPGHTNGTTGLPS